MHARSQLDLGISDSTADVYVLQQLYFDVWIIGSSREEVHAPKSEPTYFAGKNLDMVPGDVRNGSVLQEAHERNDSVYEALPYDACSLLSLPSTLAEESQECILKHKQLGDLLEVTQCLLET